MIDILNNYLNEIMKRFREVNAMKWQRFPLSFCYLLISSFLIISGCSKPILKMPKSLPLIIREYKHIPLYAGIAGMQNTGIYLNEGDFYSILATGSMDLWPGAPSPYEYHDVRPEHRWPFMMRIGKHPYSTPLSGDNASTRNAYDSGYLYLGYREGEVDPYGEPLNPEYYENSTGFFSVDIIVWEREDWVQIADFFKKMKQKDPSNKAIIDAFDQASRHKEIYLASKKASKEIEETKKKIQELKEEPEQEKKPAVEESYVTAKTPTSPVPKIAPAVKPPEVEIEPIYEKPAKAQKTVTLPKISKYYAVVICIGKYQDDRIPKLKYTTVDAEEMYNILTDPQYGDFPKNQVKLLIDEQATYNNIKSAIGTWLRRNARKDDTVIIFYAGHGAPEDEKTYWVTYNANIDD